MSKMLDGWNRRCAEPSGAAGPHGSLWLPGTLQDSMSIDSLLRAGEAAPDRVA